MNTAYSVADADPVAAVLAWLAKHPKVHEALGGPGHVSGIREAPWPHLRVTSGPGGDMRTLEWATEPEVTLEVYGDPGGWPGPAALRRIALVAALAAKELPDATAEPGQPVVTSVRPSGALIDSPLADGQPRHLFGLLVTVHPPLTPA
ncbi:hypothetical protein ACIQ9R_36440 [Streptomyces sp. NPDC094447]|uniref:hypothetical protein n=1 Tax=Streptomyces sp. NPDC094447 TaxID=3366062 RepID=UPI003819D022